jgi:hypothetical protein
MALKLLHVLEADTHEARLAKREQRAAPALPRRTPSRARKNRLDAFGCQDTGTLVRQSLRSDRSLEACNLLPQALELGLGALLRMYG